MDPKQYDGKEWHQLLTLMTSKEIKKSIKGAYRRIGNNARKIAVDKLNSSGIHSTPGLEKSLRLYVYSRGGGFMLTTKVAKNGKGIYTNHRGIKKPVLMWAAEGTKKRHTKSRFFSRKGHSTGSMRKYGFMDSATVESYKLVESNLQKEIELSVDKIAKKAGLI